MVLDVSKRQTGEAFVMFANIDEMELALRQMEGKKIRNTLIKSFRSSEEQLRYYCDTVTAVASNNSHTATSSMQTRVNSVPNLCECQIRFINFLFITKIIFKFLMLFALQKILSSTKESNPQFNG